ncbi:MAG: hypothetical protein IKC84_01550 [Helicobacteraceae bacterium]|nr:hypothetical protein [Helicobacteraceae bacterium]
MLKIILSLFCFTIFAFANSCDFSDKNQKECKLDIDNPPIFLHKFVDSNNNVFTKYNACVYDGKFQYEDREYDVIDCSMIQDGELFTEGIFFENKNSANDESYSLKTNKEIELENDNIMLIVAGDVILDSGIRINSKNPKNFILEIIEGTNGKGNLILNRGSKINANAIIMPSGSNATIKLNTFFGGSNQKDFIDIIDSDNISKRYDMDTNLTANGIYAINSQDASIIPYDGNIICGPEVNPFNLNNKEYLLKKLIKDNYNVEITKLDIDPNYGIFIESGKIASNNSLNRANIKGQNSGKCNSPMQLAFSKEIIDRYNTKKSKSSDEKSQTTMTTNEVEENIPSNITLDNKKIDSVIVDSDINNTADFAIIEQNVFDKFTKLCNGNIECLNNSIKPYKNIVWNKISSQNNINSIYVINLANNNTKVQCEVLDYYGENIQYLFNLSKNNTFEKIDLKFPKSTNNKTKIVCQSQNLKLETNPIQVNPAKFDLIPTFGSENLDRTLSLKAGVINISFEGSKALNLEGEIDTGFSGRLFANNNNLKFTQNKCGYPNDDVFIQDTMIIGFKDGKADKYLTSFIANTITNGDLSIDFDIEGDYKKCGNELEPKCTKINITENINVIPDNFMIKTDIISPYKVAYYGQLEDRNAFKYNPILNIRLSAVNNKNEVININQLCNHGVVELSLDSEAKIEFKRSITDRLNSKINVYLDEFSDKQVADVDMYFGISKILNNYNNIIKINQSDLVEPKEIKLTDLVFYIRFKSNGKTYDYNDLVVYDRLADNSMPVGILFARGKIEKNISYTDDKKANLDLKYLIYCKSCDKKTIEKYLNVEDITMDSPNWYINREHPSDFYLSNDFIETDLEIDNSNQVIEGRQQIIFDAQKNDEYNVIIKQKDLEFAPQLNYNKDFKNMYLDNTFNVVISKPEEIKQPQKIEENKEIQKPIEKPKIIEKKPKKPATKKQTTPKKSESIELDIEE